MNSGMHSTSGRRRACLAMAMALALGLAAFGCASKNVDPAKAAAKTGYVDFYSDTTAPLCWEIGKISSTNEPAKIIFEEYEVRAERILRLKFKPGQYQLQVSFLNRILPEAAVADVVVRDGMVTPVRVTLTRTGEALVEDRRARVQGTFYGRYGRATRLRSDESGVYHVNVEEQSPVPFQPKSQMSYATTLQPAGNP
jgi:hypothetical protein